ncbi:MAG TPA: hypothetical protein VNP73_08400, partial [Actinomycetota bacterium]|nr:hypothetical protein [Actinomycetota bacterium]
FSAGVASLDPTDTPGGFLTRADEALYLAKHRGRNRVEHDPTPEAIAGNKDPSYGATGPGSGTASGGRSASPDLSAR